MANLLNTGLNLFTNASVDSLVNGTIDTGLNLTFSSLFNRTYDKNGTEGAVVETVINLVKSETFRPVVLPLVILGAGLVSVFLWWRQCGCCSWCCCSCLKPRGTAQCGACPTCQYVIQGPVLRKDKKFCSHLCGDPRKMTFLKFRESCQSDCVVFCIHCDKCGKKFIGETARTLDKRMQSILDMVDRKDEGFVVSEHFTRPDHSKDDLSVQILEAGTNRTSWDRDGAKDRWIRKLQATDAGGD